MKQNLKKCVLLSLFAGAVLVPLSAGAEAVLPNNIPDAGTISNLPKLDPEIMKMEMADGTYDLKLDTKDYQSRTMQVNGQAVRFRVYANRIYTAKPVALEYEQMNIYVPEEYFQGKSINGYTAKTAPIFLPNEVGGYMPGKAGEPEESSRHPGPNAALTALSRGYVVAAPALRGRTLQSADGKYTGKAPACIVDYKAAVRYLRFNRDRLPAGDTEKIISNGTSAGGALSALLGATGNHPDYAGYLKEIGAANERDDIFASMDYCPITNLEHADMAYEWVFHGVNEYHQGTMGPMIHMPAEGEGSQMPGSIKVGDKIIPLGPGPVVQRDAAGSAGDRPANAPAESSTVSAMSAEQVQVSGELKKLFPAYVNSLGLKAADGSPLTLDADGSGSFRDYIEGIYMRSAQQALDQGIDLSDQDWLTIENGKVVGMDLALYAQKATRLKAAPAFDALDMSSGENNLFGTSKEVCEHFTAFSAQRGSSKLTADSQIIRLMNPMNYIGDGQATAARHWRIRHGAMDRDTSLAIPAILAAKLANSGYDVDFASPWGRGHDGDYDLTELFDWADRICKAK